MAWRLEDETKLMRLEADQPITAAMIREALLHGLAASTARKWVEASLVMGATKSDRDFLRELGIAPD